MASRSGSRRSWHSHVYLVGHGLLLLGFIFFIVGFATAEWMETGNSLIYGLWGICYSTYCVTDTSRTFTSWMLATRAMQTMALICYLLGVLLALFFNCTAQVMSGHMYSGKARVLEIFTIVGNFLCLIGVSVYGSEGDDMGTLEYSYSLSVFSLFLTTPGVIMVALTRNYVTISTTNVAPDGSGQGGGGGGGGGGEDGTATTVTMISPPVYGSDGLVGGDGQYPYGRGQHNQGYSQDVWYNGGGGGSLSYPYGQGRGGDDDGGTTFPSPPSRPLPFPLYPDEPGGNAAAPRRSISMPEPGPIGGGGRRGVGDGGDGGGGGFVTPRGQGRLPPITSVNPSAPPDDYDDQPPSYLEAIGHSAPRS